MPVVVPMAVLVVFVMAAPALSSRSCTRLSSSSLSAAAVNEKLRRLAFEGEPLAGELGIDPPAGEWLLNLDGEVGEDIHPESGCSMEFAPSAEIADGR
jgi:hypothetical protein